MKTALFFSLAFCVSAFAAVISDTPSKFVFEDFVKSTAASACDDGGVRLAPENAVFLPGSALPYRAYRVARSFGARSTLLCLSTDVLSGASPLGNDDEVREPLNQYVRNWVNKR